MALLFNNDQIIYYHMDALWSMILAQMFFAYPDY